MLKGLVIREKLKENAREKIVSAKARNSDWSLYIYITSTNVGCEG